MSKNYFQDTFDKNQHIHYLYKEKLFSGKSDFQKIEIYNTEGFGKILVHDDVVMSTTKDEAVYHEMISHVPLFSHPNPEKVLIIGGGDGGTAREVLKHSCVKRCKMVEIDSMVVENSKKHLEYSKEGLNHPSLDLTIGDGIEFVKTTDEMFDVVIVDSTDPVGPAEDLFGPGFYKDVERILTAQGVVTAQGMSYAMDPQIQKNLLRVLKEFFPHVGMYNYTNSTYVGMWAFAFASKQKKLVFQKERFEKQSWTRDLKYYNEDMHHACFALPQNMKKNLLEFSSEA